MFAGIVTIKSDAIGHQYFAITSGHVNNIGWNFQTHPFFNDKNYVLLDEWEGST